MLIKANVWKLQDAKARFSELVRRARGGEPQHVTVHGKEAVVVVDPERFDVTPKAPQASRTMRDLFEMSKKYRAIAEGVDFEPRMVMDVTPRPVFFEDDEAPDDEAER